MARSTTPSLWLPGFDPEPPESLATPIETDPPAPLISAARDGEPSQETTPAAARSAWRVVPPAAPTSAPILWPPLTRNDLHSLDGAVTKFEANLAAIRTLHTIDAENRPASTTERGALLRYTGWGGLPASFNLEADDTAWRSRAVQLQSALSSDDYESARASVNNSHYTEVHMIEAMWQAIAGFGFTGGRVLEPAAGIGHFIGAMPRSIAERSRITAIEIDRLSGRMLRALYAPAGVDVRISAFEKAALPDHWFDLVIGNVPFGRYQAADVSNRAYACFSIHNYFFGRALDLLRPGGLVCFITSSHTMDAQHDAVREHIASQAHLLGAIRLPRDAFAGIASTQVQTDILFLRKRQRTEEVQAEWLDLGIVPDSLMHPQCHQHHRRRHLPINAWYAKHPAFCIGRIRSESNGYEDVPIAVFEGNLEAALRERVAWLPVDVYHPVSTRVLPLPAAAPDKTGARPGGYRIHQGRVHRTEQLS